MTITIDTTRQKKKAVKLNRSRITPRNGWQRTIKTRQKGFWQKFISFKRNLGDRVCKVGGQIAMF